MKAVVYSNNELYHHGVLGQKWGVRKYQNADGTYNSAGKKRYGIGDGESYNGVKGPKIPSSSKSVIKVTRTDKLKAKADDKAERAKIREDAKAAKRQSKIDKQVANAKYKADKLKAKMDVKMMKQKSKLEAKEAKAKMKAEKEASITPEERAKKKKVTIAVGASAAAVAVTAVAGVALSTYVKRKGGAIAAKSGEQAYKKMMKDNPEIASRLVTSVNNAAKSRGQSDFNNYVKNQSTIGATRDVLKYLGTGKSLKSVNTSKYVSPESKSTVELAISALAAQISKNK